VNKYIFYQLHITAHFKLIDHGVTFKRIIGIVVSATELTGTRFKM